MNALKLFLTGLFFTELIMTVFTQNVPMGIFDGQTDIGNVKIKGSSIYNAESQDYLMKGSGYNIWFDRDEFHFLWKRMKGDFILTANIEFVGKGTDPHRKIGWMIRSSFDTSSSHICVAVHGDGLTSLQFRRAAGGLTEEVRSNVTAPSVIQLERRGNTFIMSVANAGEPFSMVHFEELMLNDEVYAGLFICSHNPDVAEKAVFHNVRITIPASEDFIPYRDYIGSRLEILDIETGKRKIIYETSEAIQAPNWTADGRLIIFNSNGLLYSYNLIDNTIKVINTGFADANNNDHVLSCDGKMIGISHHSKEDKNQSIIYVLPVEGSSRPKRITKKGPSYLHGWSPDGKYLLYTGERGGQYDIYQISIKGGKEKQLTNTPKLDDGAEYTPDGKYIYFNSNRMGLMQIWRMNADGSNQQQVTNDSFNNWFPHVSPDGKWIVFLSYGKEVDPGDHPYYKQVYLRLMPVEGGNPHVIAWLYGGQGTINVPSWSPDSKRIAFISNSR
jgi:Tol biopolymer transport system component